MNLSDRVREILAADPNAKGADVARLLGLDVKSAGALVSYARRSPLPGGASGRGGAGGARPTKGPPAPASGHPDWAAASAPVLAFLRASQTGRSHVELKVWRRGVKGMGPTRLSNALAWLEIQGLARSEGDRHPNRQHSKAKDGTSRAHLVRWFGGVPASAEKDFGDY